MEIWYIIFILNDAAFHTYPENHDTKSYIVIFVNREKNSSLLLPLAISINLLFFTKTVCCCSTCTWIVSTQDFFSAILIEVSLSFNLFQFHMLLYFPSIYILRIVLQEKEVALNLFNIKNYIVVFHIYNMQNTIP